MKNGFSSFYVGSVLDLKDYFSNDDWKKICKVLKREAKKSQLTYLTQNKHFTKSYKEAIKTLNDDIILGTEVMEDFVTRQMYKDEVKTKKVLNLQNFKLVGKYDDEYKTFDLLLKPIGKLKEKLDQIYIKRNS